MLCLHMCTCTMCTLDTLRGQKRMSDTLELNLTRSCEPPCGCREPNQGPLQEQQVHFSTEPSL